MDPFTRSLRNGLVSNKLGREAHKREQTGWVERALSETTSLIVPVRGEASLFYKKPEPRAALFAAPVVSERISPDTLVYLGYHRGKNYFAISVVEAADHTPWEQLDDGLAFDNLWSTGMLISQFEASLLAYARGMCYWHDRTQYCGTCGSRTRSERTGHLRVCTNSECRANYFPRTDPAVIVLVHGGDYCLLGNKAGWPENRFSTIAGFVETGETIEQAVVREVKEETGVNLGALEYHSSQPWPFPGSVMLGFHAEATSRKITLADGELRDARWFSKTEVLAAKAKTGWLRLPSRLSIARRLVEDWCHS